MNLNKKVPFGRAISLQLIKESEDSTKDRPVTLDSSVSPTPHAVLKELFELLEEYAPTWYTEEHHNRAVAALRIAC